MAQHAEGGNHSRQSASGLLLRDNVYGTLAEDAARRDLTVNALYYDAGKFEVFDHVHGLQDLEKRSVCIIGDPEQRYTEDPVRMLRVVRFAAKLDFSIDQQTAAAIPHCAHLLEEIPAARLFDEFLKLFLAGYAARTLDKLLECDLLRYLFPNTNVCMQQDEKALALVQAAMGNTDQRIAQDKPVTPAFILAALLWPVVSKQFNRLEGNGEAPMVAMHTAAQSAIAGVMRHIDPAPFQPADARDLGVSTALAAAIRTQGGRTGRASSLPGRLRFPAAEGASRGRHRRVGQLVDSHSGTASGTTSGKSGVCTGPPQAIRKNPDTPPPPRMTPAYIALGSNLSRPQSQLQQAVTALAVLPDTRLVRVSSIYRSTAVGPGTQPDYLNAVLLLDTKLSPLALLDAMQLN